MHPNTDGTAHKINALFETRDEARGRLLEVLHKVRKLEKEKAHQMETDPADQRSKQLQIEGCTARGANYDLSEQTVQWEEEMSQPFKNKEQTHLDGQTRLS